MRNKYRSRLDMNKTGGKAIQLKLTNFKPALKNLQIKARGKVRSSWNQDCGAKTQISVSCSRHSNSSLRLQNNLAIEKLKTIALSVLAK